jgi:hypothetical protein
LRQLAFKTVLLDKRVPKPADKSAFQAGLTHKKLWELLYGVRSSLAHGSKPDFKEPFSALGSLEQVNRYVRDVAKGIVRLALQEPDLVRDLKKC